jgi:hypothetical protein
MKKSWPTLAVVFSALALVFVLTLPLHVSYYADHNAMLREIRKHPDLEVVGGWRNDDITLEEFGFTIRSTRTNLLVNFSQDGPRRPRDAIEGIAIRTDAFHHSGNTTQRIYAYIRFDSAEWNQRGLPEVRTLADVFAHYDAIAYSLTTQIPSSTLPAGSWPDCISLNPSSQSFPSGPVPRPLSIFDHGLLKELIEKITP